MAVELVGNNSELKTMQREEIEKEATRLTGGVKIDNVKLSVNRGKYFAIIFDAKGDPCYETDPDDGTSYMSKLVGDSGWQFVDAIHAKLNHVPGAAKFMAWKWSAKEAKYLPARSIFNAEGKQDGEEGIIDHYIRRKAGKSTAISLPGVAELDFLAVKAKEIAGIAKKAKGVFQPADRLNITRYFALFMKAMNTDQQEGLKMLREYWPELFAKPTK